MLSGKERKLKFSYKNLVITDTIDNLEKVKSAKNIEATISGLMGEAIKRIQFNFSIRFIQIITLIICVT